MVLRIWHRWASWYMSENTLGSFQKAIDLWVDMIELDVYICKSWEAVVIHDNLLNRTTNGFGYVEEMDLNDLKSLDAWNWEKIPILEEVLDLIDKKCIVNIELKWENTFNKISEILLKYMDKFAWNKEHFMISSFRHNDLLEFNKLISDIKLWALIGHLPLDNSFSFTKLPYYSLNLDKSFISKEFVIDAHNNWFKVLVYTVDDVTEIDKMKKIGVDGIFSNYPDKI